MRNWKRLQRTPVYDVKMPALWFFLPQININKPHVLTGEKTFLRPVKSEDFEFVMECENNPEMWPISETPGPFDEATIRDFIEMSGNLKVNGQERWVIFDEHKSYVGLLDLFSYDHDSKSAGVGIMIADTANRKKGYAGDALVTLINNLKEHNRVLCLQALIYTDNEPSRRLFEKCGFDARGSKFYKGKSAIQYVIYL